MPIRSHAGFAGMSMVVACARPLPAWCLHLQRSSRSRCCRRQRQHRSRRKAATPWSWTCRHACPTAWPIDLCGLHLRNVGEVIEALGRMRCSASCEGLKVYLHREPVDFRLSINGLAVRVGRPRGLDPFASCVYVFSNRRRDRVKILGWERNGFWLLLKRLEKDRFIWPWTEAVSTLTAEQLHWLLEGIDIAVVQHHALLRYSSVA
jgi:transposase